MVHQVLEERVPVSVVPWKGLDEVEFATLDWVSRYNERRLLEPIGQILPVEFLQMFYRIRRPASQRPDSTRTLSGKPGALQRASWAGW